MRRKTIFEFLGILLFAESLAGNINGAVYEDRRTKVGFKGPRGPSAFYFLPDNGYLSDDDTMDKDMLIEDKKPKNYRRSETPIEFVQPLEKPQNLLVIPNVKRDEIIEGVVNEAMQSSKNKIGLLKSIREHRDNDKLWKRDRNIHSRIVTIDTPTTRASVYKRYVQKHLKHPTKLFKRVIDVLKKRSGHSSDIPANYYLVPSGALKRSRAKVKKTIENGKRHTEIDTRKFHISILEKQPLRLRKKLQENPSRRSDLSVDKVNDVRKKTIENQILSLVLNKLHKQRRQTAGVRQNILESKSSSHRASLLDEIEEKENESEEIINAIRRRQEKKRRLTNLFVRFMEDLTEKLNLDPLSIADLMVRRAASKRNKVYRRF